MERIRIVTGFLAALLALASPQPARAQCDTAPPNLTAFDFSPTSVNTTTSSQNVTCNMTLNDATSGVASATCQLRFLISPSQSRHGYSCTTTTGTAGVYSCVVTLPRYADAGGGNWKAWVASTDNVGNTRLWKDTDLAIQGFPTDLTVVSDPDLVYPDITALSVTPSAVDVSTGAKTLTCTMTLTDAKSGVESARCFLNIGDVYYAYCDSSTPQSGTRQSGVFECVITMPQYAAAGVWTAEVTTQDLVGNGVQFNAAALQAKGLPVHITVTSSPEDVDGPLETSFDFNPKTAAAGAGPTTITCSFEFIDSPAGVSRSACDFTFIDNSVFPPVYYTQGCAATALASGTRQSGTMSCNFLLPRYSPPGSWFAATTYIDAAGNGSDYVPATPLTVDCSSVADPESTLSWSDKTTLTWNAIAGATRYNVYRGDLASLATLYGLCQNSRDPNLTDLQFLETQDPSPAGQAFNFLVSYASGGVEKGLGKRSSGAPRTVSSPCP